MFLSMLSLPKISPPAVQGVVQGCSGNLDWWEQRWPWYNLSHFLLDSTSYRGKSRGMFFFGLEFLEVMCIKAKSRYL